MKARRILVAEDDPASLELVKVFLESEGYDVEAALDGNRALDLGGSGTFELLILDMHMPMYGGVEVLKMMRKRFLHHPMKIIEPGPGKLAAAHLVHRRGVSEAPLVGKVFPIDVQALGLAPGHAFGNY